MKTASLVACFGLALVGAGDQRVRVPPELEAYTSWRPMSAEPWKADPDLGFECNFVAAGRAVVFDSLEYR